MKSNNLDCKKCKSNFIYHQQEVFFDDKGFGYSTKLVKCPECGCINVIQYIEDRAIKLNNDSRYYDYRRESFLKD